MAIGPKPRYLEELSIGGGYGDTADGGADLEKNGDISTDGDITLKGILNAGSSPQPLTNATGEIDGARIEAGTVDSVQLASDLSLDGNVEIDNLSVAGDTRIDGKLVLAPEVILTIASGAMTVTQVYHRMLGEGGAADDLETINGGEVGQLLILRSGTNAYSIIVKHGTGNLTLAGDFNMNSSVDTLVLFKGASNWVEISRSNNG